MKIIVLDLEWNQSSTGNEPETEKIPFEIIEIGAVGLSDDYRMIREFSEFVKPQVYKKMHSYTSKLIHIQMSQLETGDPFPEVSKEFFDWCGEDYIFCTWGSSDLTELQRNLAYYDLPLLGNAPVKYIDAQKLFSLVYENGSKNRKALESAVDQLDIEKDIPFHRAFSDAYYTAKIFERIAKERPDVLQYVSYDISYPPASHDDEINVDFGTYVKYISSTFEDKESALKDEKVSSMVCYKCGKVLKKKLNWFTTNDRHYYALANCDKHGILKGKVRIQRTGDGKVFVVKTSKLVSKETAAEIRSKYNKVKQKNKQSD